MNDLHTPDTLTPHVLQRGGCPLHYWTGGTAVRPLVVLLHGATMDHRMFNAQVAALLPHYRVLVWDAPGHGRSRPLGAQFTLESCARDLLAVLDAEGVETAVIAGHSFGGYIAQTVYRLAPARVRALVIIGATSIAEAYSRFEIAALKFSLRLFRIWPYGNLLNTIGRGTAVTPAAQAYARHAAGQIPKADFLTIWRAVTLAIDSRGRPDARIAVPLLLLHGDGDSRGTIRRDMPRWAAAAPHAVYHVIPSAGHNANQDNPEFTNRVLLDFLP
ncbi:MAG: alpha/beta hydrolase [Anaerolineales bacterium]|nr:alpha/beta hydrolase [Anaerolineales bacterium]